MVAAAGGGGEVAGCCVVTARPKPAARLRLGQAIPRDGGGGGGGGGGAASLCSSQHAPDDDCGLAAHIQSNILITRTSDELYSCCRWRRRR